jgi:hypothetical protein
MDWLLVLSAVSGLVAVAFSLLARLILEPAKAPNASPGLRRALIYLAVAAAMLCGLALFAWAGAVIVDTILNGDEDSPGIGY